MNKKRDKGAIAAKNTEKKRLKMLEELGADIFHSNIKQEIEEPVVAKKGVSSSGLRIPKFVQDDELNKVNEINELDEANEINELDEANEINEANKSDEFDEFDFIGTNTIDDFE